MAKKKCFCAPGAKCQCGDCDKIHVHVKPELLIALRSVEKLHREAGCQPFKKKCVLCALKKYSPPIGDLK